MVKYKLETALHTTWFTAKDSIMSRPASGSIQVVTKDARSSL